MTPTAPVFRRLLLIACLAAAAPLQAEDQLPQQFFETHCVGCHSGEEASAGVQLDDADTRDWSDHQTSEFFERVLKVVRSGRMPPPDAGDVSEQERAAAADSLHNVLMERSGTGGTLLRRLTRFEYENTIEKVFGIDFDVPPGFPADNPSEGFDNTAEGLVISAPLMEAYFQSAIAVADKIIPPPRRPVPSTHTSLTAENLVISYSSGVVIDDAMRLAARTDSMWRSSTWPESFEIRTPGIYRISVSASQFAPPSAAWPNYDDAMILEVRARSLNDRDGQPPTQQRLLARFEVTEEAPATFECDAELYPAETPIFYFANAPIDGDSGDKDDFANVLRMMFQNDPRLLAGWLTVEHSRGLRGGVGWDRVKAIRDSADLDLDAIDMSDEAVDELIETMTKDTTLYSETVVYQLFEEGPALEIHGVEIQGPLEIVPTPEEQRLEQAARRLLGKRDGRSDEEFVRSFLRRFLTKAFRRPASDGDVDEYAAVVMDHVGEGHGLDEGLHLALRTALMSPRFLYRGHRPGRLDDFDLATRLSYFLTAGPPDDALYAAAAAGELSHPEILDKHARRLLTSKVSDRFVSDFTAQWLGTRDLPDIMPDARLFPDFTPEHRDAMIAETEAFFREILRSNLPLETFIQPRFTFVNKSLAEDIYHLDGIDLKGNKLVRVSLPADSPHGGLLGQAGPMMATANGVDTQPVVRGVWVLENILGDPPPPPPENVPALTPDTSGAQTVRELLAAHRSEESCATCHRRIDPLGFVLENFDPVGRWRTHYREFSMNAKGKTIVADGQPVEAAAAFPGAEFPDAVEFQHVNDLKRHVASNIDQFANCLSRKLLTYATGRPLSYAEKQEVDHIVAAIRERGNGFQDLLLALIQSEAFRVK